MHAEDRRLDAQVDVLGHQRDLGVGVRALERQRLAEDRVVRAIARQLRERRVHRLRLEEQPPGRLRLGAAVGADGGRRRARQRQAAIDVGLGRALHQLVEEATDLAHVARGLGQSLLPGVELLEHDHRDEDVVFLEAEDRGRIVHQDVGVEHEHAPLGARGTGHGRRPTGRARLRAPLRRGRRPSPCAIRRAARPSRPAGRCCARRPCTSCRTCSFP